MAKAHYGNIKEEELKNKVAQDYFSRFDTTKIIGNIDFCVAFPGRDLFMEEAESCYWAEAKKGINHDMHESIAQLVITIGKAHTYEKHNPPYFLGALDAEKIAFIPYTSIQDIFYQSDFNWKVTPSDHTTKEFHMVLEIIEDTLRSGLVMFRFGQDDEELGNFIRTNFVMGNAHLTRIPINKNNFLPIYQKWRKMVMPTIGIDWEQAKQAGIIDADFYLADLLSEKNKTIKDKLYVLLRSDRYELDRKQSKLGTFNSTTIEFNDGQAAHTQFWNRYQRPPREEYWAFMVERRDLLVPQDVRERKGSFFTPQQWVELSQQYIADALGDDWRTTTWCGTAQPARATSSTASPTSTTSGPPPSTAPTWR